MGWVNVDQRIDEHCHKRSTVALPRSSEANDPFGRCSEDGGLCYSRQNKHGKDECTWKTLNKLSVDSTKENTQIKLSISMLTIL